MTLVLCAFTASATNWYASPDGTGGGTSPTDRGDAVATVQKMKTGDTIYFASGTYMLDRTKTTYNASGSGAYFRTPDNVSNLTFIGETGNPEDVRLVGTPADKMRIFYFKEGGHTVRDLLCSGGYTSYQGAGLSMSDVFVNGKSVSEHEKAFTASNCIVENCSAAYQGANRGGVWRNCVIRNNEVRNMTAAPQSGVNQNNNEGSGGGVFDATLYDCVITNNTAGFCGGGLAGGRTNGGRNNTICRTMAYNCLIGWNTAQYGAGAGVTTSFTGRAYCQLYNCTVISNTASQLGGGAFLCTIASNSTICGNYVPRSGNNALDGSTAAGGGVAYCDVSDSTLECNQCQQSGAGAAKSNLAGCRIENNTATRYGGGAYACALVKDSLLAGNKGDHGGAGFNGYFENCVMTNNTATIALGGATYNATSRNCIVVGNYAKQRYAHARGAHYGDLVYGNKNGDASGSSGIGADEANANESLPVVNCTVWGNLNGSRNVSRATLTNSVAWSVEDNIHSAVNSFWRSGTVANQTGCISGTDKNPKFVGIDGTVQLTEEQAKGAPWAAWAIRVSSPCFNKGVLLPGQREEKDVLGNPRVKYGGVDMGALECCMSPGFSLSVR